MGKKIPPWNGWFHFVGRYVADMLSLLWKQRSLTLEHVDFCSPNQPPVNFVWLRPNTLEEIWTLANASPTAPPHCFQPLSMFLSACAISCVFIFVIIPHLTPPSLVLAQHKWQQLRMTLPSPWQPSVPVAVSVLREAGGWGGNMKEDWGGGGEASLFISALFLQCGPKEPSNSTPRSFVFFFFWLPLVTHRYNLLPVYPCYIRNTMPKRL